MSTIRFARTRPLIGLSALTLLAALPFGVPRAQAADPDMWSLRDFAQVRRLVRPSAGENRWNEVRWSRTLWEAHKRAVTEGKPIVVFTTGGEPLGIC